MQIHNIGSADRPQQDNTGIQEYELDACVVLPARSPGTAMSAAEHPDDHPVQKNSVKSPV